MTPLNALVDPSGLKGLRGGSAPERPFLELRVSPSLGFPTRGPWVDSGTHTEREDDGILRSGLGRKVCVGGVGARTGVGDTSPGRRQPPCTPARTHLPPPSRPALPPPSGPDGPAARPPPEPPHPPTPSAPTPSLLPRWPPTPLPGPAGPRRPAPGDPEWRRGGPAARGRTLGHRETRCGPGPPSSSAGRRRGGPSRRQGRGSRARQRPSAPARDPPPPPATRPGPPPCT